MMKDLVVIGGGHAGCEAALAGARMGLDTLLLTLNMTASLTWRAIPLSAAAQRDDLVRELDAIGGEIGRRHSTTTFRSRNDRT